MNYLQRKRYNLLKRNFHGYARTTMGLPMVASDAINANAISLEVKGNVVRNTEPTYEAPVGIYGCGDETGNLFDPYDLFQVYTSDRVSVDVDDDGWTTAVYNNTETVNYWLATYTRRSPKILPNTNYYLVVEIAEMENCYLVTISSDTANGVIGQFATGITNHETGIYSYYITSREDFTECLSLFRTHMVTTAGMVGRVKYRLSLYKDNSPVADTFVYAPFGESVTDDTVNLYDVNDVRSAHSSATVDDEDWISMTVDNTSGSSTAYGNYWTRASSLLKPNSNYICIAEIKAISGCNNLYPVSIYTNSSSQFKSDFGLSTTGIYIYKLVTSDDITTNVISMLRTFISVPAGNIGTCTFRLTIIENLNPPITSYDYTPQYKLDVSNKGTNLYNVNNRTTASDGSVVSVDDNDYLTLSYDNTNGTATTYKFAHDLPSIEIKTDTVYLCVTEVKNISNCLFHPYSYMDGSYGQFNADDNTSTAKTMIKTIRTLGGFTGSKYMTRSYIEVPAGVVGSVTFRISILEDTSITADTFKYTPYFSPRSSFIYLTNSLKNDVDSADIVTIDPINKKAEFTDYFYEYAFRGGEITGIGGSNDYGTIYQVKMSKRRYNNATLFYCNKCLCENNSVVTPSASVKTFRGIAGGSPDYVYFFIPTEMAITTDAEFKAWLLEQYKSGDPIKVAYRTAEPTIMNISNLQDWDTLSNVCNMKRGTNIVNVSSNVKPSSVKLTYYADRLEV